MWAFLLRWNLCWGFTALALPTARYRSSIDLRYVEGSSSSSSASLGFRAPSRLHQMYTKRQISTNDDISTEDGSALPVQAVSSDTGHESRSANTALQTKVISTSNATNSSAARFFSPTTSNNVIYYEQPIDELHTMFLRVDTEASLGALWLDIAIQDIRLQLRDEPHKIISGPIKSRGTYEVFAEVFAFDPGPPANTRYNDAGWMMGQFVRFIEDRDLYYTMSVVFTRNTSKIIGCLVKKSIEVNYGSHDLTSSPSASNSAGTVLPANLNITNLPALFDANTMAELSTLLTLDDSSATRLSSLSPFEFRLEGRFIVRGIFETSKPLDAIAMDFALLLIQKQLVVSPASILRDEIEDTVDGVLARIQPTNPGSPYGIRYSALNRVLSALQKCIDGCGIYTAMAYTIREDDQQKARGAIVPKVPKNQPPPWSEELSPSSLSRRDSVKSNASIVPNGTDTLFSGELIALNLDVNITLTFQPRRMLPLMDIDLDLALTDVQRQLYAHPYMFLTYDLMVESFPPASVYASIWGNADGTGALSFDIIGRILNRLRAYLDNHRLHVALRFFITKDEQHVARGMIKAGPRQDPAPRALSKRETGILSFAALSSRNGTNATSSNEEHGFDYDTHYNVALVPRRGCPLGALKMDLALQDVQRQLYHQPDRILGYREAVEALPPSDVYAVIWGTGVPGLPYDTANRILNKLQHYIDGHAFYFAMLFTVRRDGEGVATGVIRLRSPIIPAPPSHASTRSPAGLIDQDSVKASSNATDITIPHENAGHELQSVPSESTGHSGRKVSPNAMYIGALGESVKYEFRVEEYTVLVHAWPLLPLDAFDMDVALAAVQQTLYSHPESMFRPGERIESNPTCSAIAIIVSNAPDFTFRSANGVLNGLVEWIDNRKMYCGMQFSIYGSRRLLAHGIIKGGLGPMQPRASDASLLSARDTSVSAGPISDPALDVDGSFLAPQDSATLDHTLDRRFEADGGYSVHIRANTEIQFQVVFMDTALIGLQMKLYQDPDHVLGEGVPGVAYENSEVRVGIFSPAGDHDNMTYRDANRVLDAMNEYIDLNSLWYAIQFDLSRGGRKCAVGLFLRKNTAPIGGKTRLPAASHAPGSPVRGNSSVLTSRDTDKNTTGIPLRTNKDPHSIVTSTTVPEFTNSTLIIDDQFTVLIRADHDRPIHAPEVDLALDGLQQRLSLKPFKELRETVTYESITVRARIAGDPHGEGNPHFVTIGDILERTERFIDFHGIYYFQRFTVVRDGVSVAWGLIEQKLVGLLAPPEVE